jgi:5-methylcytosine-specific restriction endonuclease McrA
MFKIREPVKCGNPKIIDTINHGGRTISKDWLKPIRRDGKEYCAWCNVKKLPSGRKKYCSDDCIHSSDAYCYPQSSEHAFRFLMIRQDFKCGMCEFSYLPAYHYVQKRSLSRFRREIIQNIKWIKTDIPGYKKYQSERTDNTEQERKKELADLEKWEMDVKHSITSLVKNYFKARKELDNWTYGTSDGIRSYHRNLKDHREPEVDHMIPVGLGGMAVGFDNHQILCYSCHKQKSKKDVADIRKAQKDDTLPSHVINKAKQRAERQERYRQIVEEAQRKLKEKNEKDIL